MSKKIGKLPPVHPGKVLLEKQMPKGGIGELPPSPAGPVNSRGPLPDPGSIKQ